MNFYDKLRRLYESTALLEYNRKDLKNFAGDDYANKFFALRDRLQAPENDLGHWIKKGDVEAFKKFIDDWESGATKSKSQKKKEERIAGAELIFDEKGWKVYHITTYDAAKQLGSGTTWCITGRYRGYETRGKEFFNQYIRDYKLDGYYFMFDTLNKDPNTGDYLKYCAGIDTSGQLRFLYNGMQDREISRIGIPNIEPERQVQPFKQLGVTLKYHNLLNIQDGILIGVDENDRRDSSAMREVKVPNNVTIIGKFAFDETYLEDIIMLDTVKEIRTGAFASTPYLLRISLPDSIEKLGNGILLSSGVKSVKFPCNLTVIPNKTCAYCKNLTNVILPDNVEEISESAFEGSDEVILDNCNEYAIEYAIKHNLEYINPETGEVMNSKR